MSLDIVFYVLAFVFFLLAGFSVAAPRVSWRDLAFAALVLTLIV